MANHTVFLDNQSLLKINGAMGVVSLTDSQAEVIVDNQILEIKGQNLKAEELSVETGELTIVGTITCIKYQEKKEKKSLIKRLFK